MHQYTYVNVTDILHKIFRNTKTFKNVKNSFRLPFNLHACPLVRVFFYLIWQSAANELMKYEEETKPVICRCWLSFLLHSVDL